MFRDAEPRHLFACLFLLSGIARLQAASQRFGAALAFRQLGGKPLEPAERLGPRVVVAAPLQRLAQLRRVAHAG